MADPAENPDLSEDESEQMVEEAEEEFKFPQDKVLYRIADWSGRLSVWILTVGIISVIIKLGSYILFIKDLPFAEWNSSRIFDLSFTVIAQMEALLYAGFLYLLLQAVTEIIYLLMDIRDLFQVTEKADGKSV